MKKLRSHITLLVLVILNSITLLFTDLAAHHATTSIATTIQIVSNTTDGYSDPIDG